MSATKRVYSAADIRHWIIDLGKSRKVKWSTAGIVVFHWIQKAFSDNRNIKECVACKELIDNGVYLNIGLDREVPCCLNCTLQSVYARIDKYLNGTAEPLDLENARDALRELLLKINPVAPLDSQPDYNVNRNSATIGTRRT